MPITRSTASTNSRRGIGSHVECQRRSRRTDTIIPLFPKLQHTLQDWCVRTPSVYVFPNWDHADQEFRPFTSFQAFWKNACRRAGVEDVRIHDLRHTFASWWAQRGGNMDALREMLGHADLRMVARYAHLNSDAQHKAVADLNDLI
ncbi:site-specific integrase [Antarctobacter heliothermus]|uniref:site-specific integrase n=1 Tax=Antarctobacter heliothermus TaxID=74033 RepID=UPI000B7813D1|nr:site-specific integrase [Antarctobacter heliothermus]